MAEEILRVENIKKRFGGVVALDDVSLSIRKGEILCLVGENGSGKSTLIKMISGVYQPDEGDIYINNNHYKKLTPIESINEGIQVIYQDFSLFPNLTVAENIAINGQLASGKQLINWKEMYQVAKTGLSKIDASLPPDAIVETLSTADRQMIAIVKALLANASIIIMDEPTTALTKKEIASLFELINELKSRGISTLFVSHKLNEVTEIADRTVILRNGKKVMDQDAKGLNVKAMEFYMTGREIDTDSIELNEVEKSTMPIMRVENLNVPHGFFDISFDLYPGEILGITGLLGSGRTELALSLFGELPAASGNLLVDGKKVKLNSTGNAVKHGIAYVPEDRIREGLFLEHSISNNIVISIINRFANRLGLLNNAAKTRSSDQWVEELNIKTPSSELPAKNLSGGNQQRVVLAKWLASDPKILILNGPTVGVDVGSKAEIHEIIRSLAKEGLGVLLISDDIPELLQTCHRILLMRAGRIVEEFKREDTNEEKLNTALVGGPLESKVKNVQ